MNERGSGILANTAYRAIADLVSKLGSVFLFVVMARKLGDEDFGVFTFALAFVTLVTALADFGQDATLTREVSRDRSRVHRYFTNTLALKLLLALPVLALALAAGRLIGFSGETSLVVLLLGVGVIADQLNSTCSSVFQAYERLVYLPIALVSQRLFTAIVGVAALVAGAGVIAVAGIYLVGSFLGLAIALWYLVRRIVQPHVTVDRTMWWPLMRAAAPIGIAAVFGAVISRVDTAMLAAYVPARCPSSTASAGGAASPARPSRPRALAAIVMLVLRDSTGIAIAAGAAVYVVTLLTLEQLAFPEDARALWTLFRPGGRIG